MYPLKLLQMYFIFSLFKHVPKKYSVTRSSFLPGILYAGYAIFYEPVAVLTFRAQIE